MRFRVLVASCCMSVFLSGCASFSPQRAALKESLETSRLLGLQLGDSPMVAVDELTKVSGAVFLKQLAPDGREAVSPILTLRSNDQAMDLITGWANDKKRAGQIVARLDHESAAVQAWITVCDGEISGIQASYSPGSAQDARHAWLERFPDDQLNFPEQATQREESVVERARGRHSTQIREFSSESDDRIRIYESMRLFTPSNGDPANAQLLTRKLEHLQECPTNVLNLQG